MNTDAIMCLNVRVFKVPVFIPYTMRSCNFSERLGAHFDTVN
jgi:hypothetical protein